MGMLKLNMKDVLASGSGTNVDGQSHGKRRLLPQSSTQKKLFSWHSSSYGHNGQCTVTFSLAQKVGKPKYEDWSCLPNDQYKLYACLSLIV